MSESGGPVFEGSSARPETVKPKLIDRIKDRLSYAAKAAKKGSPEYYEAREKWDQIGPNLEKAQLEAAEKVFNILGEGKLRKAAEMTKPVVKLIAKANRVSAAVPDVIVTALGMYGGLGHMFEGARAFFGRGEGKRMDVLTGGGQTALMIGLMWLAPTRRLETAYFKAVGNIADRVSGITDKILRGKPKAAPMPA